MEPLTADPVTFGWTTKNSRPALVAPPTLTAVSSELQSFPSAKVTWCMRVSLAVQVRDDLVVGGFRGEQQLPTARSERGWQGGVVDALAEREVAGLLVGLGRDAVGADADEGVA